MNVLSGIPKGISFEIHKQNVNVTSVRVADRVLDHVSETRNNKTTLRLIRDGVMSVAVTSRPDDIEGLTTMAMETLDYGTPINYEFPSHSTCNNLILYDERTSSMTLGDMSELAQSIIENVKQRSATLRPTVRVSKEVSDVSLTNSAGFTGDFRRSILRVQLTCRAKHGGGFLSFGSNLSGISRKEYYDSLIDECLKLNGWSEKVVDIEAGEYPVIFAPTQGVHLCRPFVAALNGKTLAYGESPWAERLGHKVLDPRITLTDDGTIEDMPTSIPFDREGIPVQKTIMIENGLIRAPLLDLETAGILEMSSTGNGTVQGPSPHRIILTPGDLSVQDLISKIDNGLLVYRSLGTFTGNPLTGNVSGTVSLGFKIEGGKVTGRVKNCLFSLNAMKHFRDHLINVSKETLDLPSGTYPYVALDKVVVTT